MKYAFNNPQATLKSKAVDSITPNRFSLFFLMACASGSTALIILIFLSQFIDSNEGVIMGAKDLRILLLGLALWNGLIFSLIILKKVSFNGSKPLQKRIAIHIIATGAILIFPLFFYVMFTIFLFPIIPALAFGFLFRGLVLWKETVKIVFCTVLWSAFYFFYDRYLAQPCQTVVIQRDDGHNGMSERCPGFFRKRVTHYIELEFFDAPEYLIKIDGLEPKIKDPSKYALRTKFFTLESSGPLSDFRISIGPQMEFPITEGGIQRAKCDPNHTILTLLRPDGSRNAAQVYRIRNNLKPTYEIRGQAEKLSCSKDMRIPEYR